MFDFIPETAIPQDEYSTINRSIWETVASTRLPRPFPLDGILHHYTDAAGLKGILESGALRATHIAFMNDATEYRHAVSLLNEAVKFEKTKKSDQPLQLALLSEMESFMDAPTPELSVPYFVACFSEERNSLNQWRAYGRGEGGFSIGFDAQLMQRNAAKQMCLLVPAMYYRKEQEALVRNILAWALEEYSRVAKNYSGAEQDEHRKNWTHVLLWELTSIAPMMKNPNFVEEKEWRLIHRSHLQGSVRFVAKQNGLAPFAEIKFASSQIGTPEQTESLGKPLPDLLPIKELWSGPGRASEASLMAGRILLGQNGYHGVPVRASGIPYRVG